MVAIRKLDLASGPLVKHQYGIAILLLTRRWVLFVEGARQNSQLIPPVFENPLLFGDLSRISGVLRVQFSFYVLTATAVINRLSSSWQERLEHQATCGSPETECSVGALL